VIVLVRRESVTDERTIVECWSGEFEPYSLWQLLWALVTGQAPTFHTES
jgi:hypothetical protein